MQLHLLVLSLLSVAHLAHARPTVGVRPHATRDINISHKSLSNGTVTSHHISSSVLPDELAKAIEGSDININLTTDRKKRSPAAGVNNSTINLTVIDSRKRALTAQEKRAQAAAQHHNIHIDASSSGAGGLGGIHNSTVNINLNQSGSKRARRTRRKVDLGDHSVIVDVSSSGTDGAEGGIEDSTVHVNILPARALNKSTGHHSIVVDSSALSSSDDSATTTGSHSAVVDTSSSSSVDSASSSTGVKNSTINLTVISPKEDAVAAAEAKVEVPSPASDAVDAPAPTMAHLSTRARAAFDAWQARIKARDVEEAEPAGFAQVRRNHASKRATIPERA